MRALMADTLVYLIYGRGPHSDEAAYSILSALHWMGASRDRYRIAVYTDQPEALAGLPVDVQTLTPDRLTEWHGPHRFNHRAKIHAAKHALERFGGRILLCDSDTSFVASPDKVFARIRPGRSVLHVAEYRLEDRCARTLAESLAGHAFLDRSGTRWGIGGRTVMFNSGVVGLHEADRGVLDEVLHLTDQVYFHARLPIIEQLAFSVCLHHFTRVQQCYDVVHHYWQPDLRAAFHVDLHRILHEPPVPPREEQYQLLRPWAPTVPVRPLQWGRAGVMRRARARTRHAVVRATELTGTRGSLRRVASWLHHLLLIG